MSYIDRLESTELRYADLSGIDFRGADMRGCSFADAALDGAIFDGATGELFNELAELRSYQEEIASDAQRAAKATGIASASISPKGTKLWLRCRTC